jgi:hypothetical protein
MKGLRALVLLLTLAPGTAYGATFTVNSSADMVDLLPGDGVCDAGGGQCTLRASIQEANLWPGDDTIRFAPSLNSIPIVLTIPPVDECPLYGGCFNEAEPASGDLDIMDNLTIVGNGAGNTILQGGASLASSVDRVFEVISPVCYRCITVGISGVTIRYAGSLALQHGGFLINGGALVTTITDSVISDNRGSGITGHYAGDILIDRVTFARNVADHGAGLVVRGFGDTVISINNSTFHDNRADDGAGGGNGGALHVDTPSFDLTSPTIFNSTFSGNIAADGCATYTSDGVLRLSNVTVADNCLPGSGAAAVVASADGEGVGSTAWRNSIVVSRPGALNCRTVASPFASGSITSEGYNISSDVSCGLAAAGDAQSTNPLLAALAGNGGPTQTHLPLPGSPAIDTGLPAGFPSTDQRGFVRPVDGNGDAVVQSDKGSVEVGAPGPGLPNSAIQGTKWNDANGDGVKQLGEAGVAGIQICLFPTSPSTCAITGAGGTYLFSNLAQGMYHVYEKLPAGRINTTPRSQQVVVPAASTVSGVDFGNRVMPPFPTGIVDASTAWTSGGTPVHARSMPLVVDVTPPCIVASASATLLIGGVTITQAMAPAGGNTWRTTFAASFASNIGHLTVNVNCAGGGTLMFDGDILFIDPSGTILDACTAQPLAGATVTLLKNEPYLSPTYVIPDPSETIPANNPEITAANGLYAWDVVPGRWRMQVSKAGYGIVMTSPFDIPPPVVGFDISLTPTAGCNTPPVANNDAYSARKNWVLLVRAPGVLANDTDPDGSRLKAVLVRRPAHGALFLNHDGFFIYLPKPGFEGRDTFTYKASDGINTSNVATVTINVSAWHDGKR